MNNLVQIELHKYFRKFNIFFSLFVFLFLLLMCYANVNVAILEKKVTTPADYLDSTTQEFVRNCLMLLPIWSIISSGIDFSNFAIQKHITDGLARIQYLKAKLFSIGIITFTIAVIYVIVALVVTSKYSTIPTGHLIASLLQVLLFSVGYLAMSFAILLIFRSTLKALVCYFVWVLIEFVLTYFLKTSVSDSFEIVGPINIIRRLGFDSNENFIQLTEVSFIHWLLYSGLVLALLLGGAYYFIKKELRPI
jgi:hypothetical protein